ncbi:MAG: bifunctional hydroxymethylpyrimidine kinase/phosphomethylpyrimidine kinase [Thermodesulfobacteriota bacterium]|nr:bifunctional hydroxymethylpyrimidine kinase/phosphomethylpyrimidine kinase [Thermodesulfobacteriota bacterium]
MENINGKNTLIHHYHRCLTIAGSDSGGGAGIQADLKTFGALGCYGMSAITALTAQNTIGVSAIQPVTPKFVIEQISAVLTDIGVDAVKIGMLFSTEIIQAVAEGLKPFNVQQVVLDPVMVAQSGDKLLKEDAIEAIKIHLMPLATVVTPNIPEASILVAEPLTTTADIRHAAKTLARHGSRAVLIKAGHLKGEQSTDLLYLSEDDRFVEISGPRIDTINNHGTGCTLSSAITAYLARGEGLETAVQRARIYIEGALKAGARYRIGQGHGPVHHYYRFWDDRKNSE